MVDANMVNPTIRPFFIHEKSILSLKNPRMPGYFQKPRMQVNKAQNNQADNILTMDMSKSLTKINPSTIIKAHSPVLKNRRALANNGLRSAKYSLKNSCPKCSKITRK